jgi:hypothetical protein
VGRFYFGSVVVQVGRICSVKYENRGSNAGRDYSMKIDNSSIDWVEEFKYLGTALADKNSLQEEINTFAAIVERSRFNNSCLRLLKISDDNNE